MSDVQIVKVGSFDCVIVPETFKFRATSAENQMQGFEYEPVVTQDDQGNQIPTGKVRRKTEVLDVSYPLLSNFGVAAEFDVVNACYQDKAVNLIFQSMQTIVYDRARALVDEGKNFTFQDLAWEVIAAESNQAKSSGRRTSIAVELLEAGCESFKAWLELQGRKPVVVSLMVGMTRQRFKNAAISKPEILAKIGERLTEWFASLEAEEREQHTTFYEFCDNKIKDALSADMTEVM